MNIKTLAAVVGTLSLASLATGCATTKTADTSASAEKGSQASCKGMATPEKGEQASCKGTATQEKAGDHSCGQNGCKGTK